MIARTIGMMYPTPSTHSGSASEIAKSTPAMGVAMKLSIVTCAVCIQPLARSSWERFTTPGMTAFVALSKSVSPRPKTSVPANSAQMSIRPVTVRTARTSATPPRMALAIAITIRRSNRSTIMPAGSPNTSHGTKARAAITEMTRGSFVSVVAISGTAIRPMPSARLLKAAAVQSLPKSRPRRSLTRGSSARPSVWSTLSAVRLIGEGFRSLRAPGRHRGRRRSRSARRVALRYSSLARRASRWRDEGVQGGSRVAAANARRA